MSHPEMSRAERALWSSAQTLAELGELTAGWFEGTIASHPGQTSNYGPSEETRTLVPLLASLNRAGFVTCSSQPGSTPDLPAPGAHMTFQRAGVSGYVDARLSATFAAALSGTPFIVKVIAPGTRFSDPFEPAVVVSRDYGATINTWAGTHHAPETVVDVTWFGAYSPNQFGIYRGCSRGVRQALRLSYSLTVVEPEWGRNDRLWPALEGILLGLS